MKLIIKIITLITVATYLNSCGNNQIKPKAENNSGITIVMPTESMPQTRLDTIKIGRILEGEKVTTSFMIRNDDSKPIVITGSVTGCGCTSVEYNTAPINPKQSREFNITFDSKDRSGTQLKTIEIISADNQVARIVMMCEVADNN